jgi:hypothetical protein
MARLASGALALGVLLSGGASAQETGRIDASVVIDAARGTVLWLPADVAAEWLGRDIEARPDPMEDAEGVDDTIVGLRLVLLHEVEDPRRSPKYRLRGCSETYTAGCPVDPPSNLDEVLNRSGEILEGRVVSREYGFYDGEAGTLLDVEVGLVLLGSRPRFQTVRVFYPRGDFDIGEFLRICAEHPDWPPTPRVGDSLLAITRNDPRDDLRRLLFDRLPLVFAQPPEGDLVVPSRWLRDVRVEAGENSLSSLRENLRERLLETRRIH